MTIDAFTDVNTARGDGGLFEPDPFTGTNGPFPTLTLLAAAMRRRWRVWAMTAIGGVIVAAGASFVSPPAYSATTTLLLNHSSTSDPSRAMATDVQLLKTRTVAGDALRRLDLSMSAKDLLSSYRVLALTDGVLQLTVDGPTGAQAVRRANAIAEAFLAFRTDELQRQSVVVVNALQDRARSITDEINGVTNDIAKATPGTDPTVLGDLLARKAVLTDQLGQLRQRIDEAVVDPTSILAKSRVVDPAGLDTRSPLKALAFNFATGIVGGLALGAGWVLVSEIASDRVRGPAEVSRALRTAVPVAVGRLGGQRWRRRHFRSHLLRPNEDVARIVSHLQRLSFSNGLGVPGLAVLSVGCDGPAAMAVACTALEYAALGKNVTIADVSGSSELADLLGVAFGEPSTFRPAAGRAIVRVTFPIVADADGANPPGTLGAIAELGGGDLMLVLAKLDPSVVPRHLVDWVTGAVAMVATGRCTITDLRVTSRLIGEAGLALDSAILVGVHRNERRVGLRPVWTTKRPRAESVRAPIQ